MVELTGPIALKDNEKRVVYGPVLIPDEPDTDGDSVDANRIETVAHTFTEKYGNVDLQHSLNNVGRLVESYILPVDLPVDNGNVIPKGSWMLGARVADDAAWKGVKEGRLTGFSIMAVQGTTAAGKSAAVKDRVTLADLGDDWIVNAVSLVDDPAVPRAKFLAIKSKDTTAAKAVSLGQLENLLQTEKEGDTVDEDKLREILEEVLNPLREQVNNIAQQMGDAANTSENSEDDADNDRAAKGAADTTGDAGSDAGDNAGGSEGADNDAGNDDAGEAGNNDDDAGNDAQDTGDTGSASEQGEVPALSDEEQKQLRKLLETLNNDNGNTVATEPVTTGNASGKSLRLTGQDGAGSQKSADDDLENDRDAFGRKLR